MLIHLFFLLSPPVAAHIVDDDGAQDVRTNALLQANTFTRQVTVDETEVEDGEAAQQRPRSRSAGAGVIEPPEEIGGAGVIDPPEKIGGADRGKRRRDPRIGVDEENVIKYCPTYDCALSKVCGEERTEAKHIIYDHRCGKFDKIPKVLDEIDAVWDCEKKKWIDSADYKENTDCFTAHFTKWVKKDGFIYANREVVDPIIHGLYYDAYDDFWDESYPKRESWGRDRQGSVWLLAKKKAEIRKWRELQQEADPNYWDNMKENYKNGRGYSIGGRGWDRNRLTNFGKPKEPKPKVVHPKNWYQEKESKKHPLWYR